MPTALATYKLTLGDALIAGSLRLSLRFKFKFTGTCTGKLQLFMVTTIMTNACRSTRNLKVPVAVSSFCFYHGLVYLRLLDSWECLRSLIEVHLHLHLHSG